MSCLIQPWIQDRERAICQRILKAPGWASMAAGDEVLNQISNRCTAKID
jgi:hypothetical protein